MTVFVLKLSTESALSNKENQQCENNVTCEYKPDAETDIYAVYFLGYTYQQPYLQLSF